VAMPRTWTVDLTESTAIVTTDSNLPKPPGYSESHGHEADNQITNKKVDQTQLKLKKARELAWSPAKSFMMTGFMLWMSGNGVHIFSIMITFYAIYNPVKSAFTVNQAFSRFADAKMSPIDKSSILTSKALFVLCNFGAMSGALYKMSLMGLLPNTPSDWVAFLAVPPAVQFSSGAVVR